MEHSKVTSGIPLNPKTAFLSTAFRIGALVISGAGGPEGEPNAPSPAWARPRQKTPAQARTTERASLRPLSSGAGIEVLIAALAVARTGDGQGMAARRIPCRALADYDEAFAA